MKTRLFITTFPSKSSAQKFSHHCLSQGWVACTQIELIESEFIWEGQITSQSEYRITLKSTDAFLERIEEHLLKTHDYTLPALLKINTEANPAFSKWLNETLSNPQSN